MSTKIISIAVAITIKAEMPRSHLESEVFSLARIATTMETMKKRAKANGNTKQEANQNMLTIISAASKKDELRAKLTKSKAESTKVKTTKNK